MARSRDRLRRFHHDLLDWLPENQRWFPWRVETATLYEVFIAEFLLSQTRASVVASVYDEFLDAYPTVRDLDGANQADVISIIEPCGMQNRRSEALLSIADRVDGTLPRSVDALLELPRVGPYVAHATICFALDERLPIVDRNVDRVYRRLFPNRWPTGENGERWAVAEELLPANQARQYNLALLDFAALVCTAQDPSCESCFASAYCQYYQDKQEQEP